MNSKILKAYVGFCFVSGFFGYWIWTSLINAGSQAMTTNWIIFFLLSQCPIIIGFAFIVKDYIDGKKVQLLDRESAQMPYSDRGMMPAHIAVLKLTLYLTAYICGFYLLYIAS